LPTYDYLCEKCGAFEEFQPISAPPLDKCPKCNGAVKRLISKNVNIIFKGSGFYTTDNRSESYKSGEKSEKSAPASEASSVAS
jgi:putative FmdB family regulatory protein